MTTKPFRLIDHVEAGLPFQGELTTLEEVAIARSLYCHRRRLDEIKAMKNGLLLLDAFLPALYARGINLADRTINTLDKGATLYVQTANALIYDDDLYERCIELGFREIGRRDYGRLYHVVALQHGQLLVEIEVTARDGITTGETNAR